MKEVICKYCKNVKDADTDFYFSKGKRHTRCKECMKKYSSSWNREHRKKIREIKEQYGDELASKTREKEQSIGELMSKRRKKGQSIGEPASKRREQPQYGDELAAKRREKE